MAVGYEVAGDRLDDHLDGRFPFPDVDFQNDDAVDLTESTICPRMIFAG